jgi:hypothetical protein
VRVISVMRAGLHSSGSWSSFSREKIPGLFPQLSAVEWALELELVQSKAYDATELAD